MDWYQEVNLENFIASSASYGGPIALRRDEQKFVKVQGTGQPTIHIFSGSGKPVASFKVKLIILNYACFNVYSHITHHLINFPTSFQLPYFFLMMSTGLLKHILRC